MTHSLPTPRLLLTAWREARAKVPGGESSPALFLARGGRRISARTDTTRIYTLPTEEQVQDAVDSATVDY